MPAAWAISSDGVRIGYHESGSGPPVLLLHGFSSSAAGWDEMGYAAPLAERYRVVAVDARGHGRSDKPDDPKAYAFERILEDVLAVADACGAERFGVVGASWGAVMALGLAARNPRVARVVGIGCAFGAAMSHVVAPVLEAWWSAVADFQRAGRLSEIGLSASELAEITGRIDARAMRAAARALATWPEIEPEDLRLPALLICGDEDEWFATIVAEQAVRVARAGITTVILPGLDHVQTFTRSDLTLPPIAEFLARGVH